MFDAQCDLAALVYGEHQDPDAVLREFAAELNAQGVRAIGMVQAGACADSSLSAVLVHSGEKLLLSQDYVPGAKGCRLDVSRLQNAGDRVADALQAGADLVIINRFGKRERDGKGLAYFDRAGAGRRYAGRDRGLAAKLCGLDQVLRRHVREAGLRSISAGGVVAQCLAAEPGRRGCRTCHRVRDREVALI
jgi:hypothetical protein